MANDSVKRLKMRALMSSMIGAALIAPIAAQTANPAANPATDPAAAAAPEAAAASEEVVVTGARRASRQFDAPSPVTVLSGHELEERGVVNLETLQFQVPALTVSNAGVANMVNIRGVGRTEVQVTDAAGVQIYRDGVPTFNGYFSGGEPYFDVGSVEVYKGPQGTFAGQNSTGGAIFVKSIDPDLEEFGGYLQGQIGSDNGAGVLGAVNIPISQTLAVRFAFVTERHDSLYDYSGPYQGHPGRFSLAAARLSVLWKPTERFTVRLKADGDYIDQGASSYSSVFAATNVYDIESDAPLKALDRFYRVSADLAYEFADGTILRSLTGYQAGKTTNWSDSDGGAAIPNTLQYSANETIVSQEINLVSPAANRFRYVLGLFYTQDELKIPSFFATQPPIQVQLVAHHRTSTNYAAFANFTYDITPDLHLELGGRFNRGTQTQEVETDAYFGPFLLAHTDAPTSLPDDDSTTGKLSLSYDIDENSFVYAFIATGHKNSGLNTDPAVATFDGEDLTDYEIGYRRKLMDKRLVFQASAYYYQYENYQFMRLDPVARTTAQLNAPGETTAYGIEAQLDGRFGDTNFNLAIAWSESDLASFFADDPRAPSPTPCPTSGPSASPQCLDLGGRSLPYLPKWTITAGLDHTFETNSGTITPRIGVSYTSDQTTSVFQGPGDALDARTIVNAQIEWAQDDWTATAFITNAFNEEYVVAVSSGLRAPGTPRQFGLRLRRSF